MSYVNAGWCCTKNNLEVILEIPEDWNKELINKNKMVWFECKANRNTPYD